MSELQATASRCATCGADLPAEGAPCPACATAGPRPAGPRPAGPRPAGPAPTEEALVVEETSGIAPAPEACGAPAEEECAPALWVRLAWATVYLLVGAACAYGSLTFFDGNFTTSSDWVFGAMALIMVPVAIFYRPPDESLSSEAKPSAAAEAI